ncbi:MAG: transcription antitermination factor NusB [Pseudomonadota bacterium]
MREGSGDAPPRGKGQPGGPARGQSPGGPARGKSPGGKPHVGKSEGAKPQGAKSKGAKSEGAKPQGAGGRAKGAGPSGGRREREAPGMAARRGAVRLIADVLDRGRMLDEAGLAGLPPAERAEAHGLADTALRHLGQIDSLLAELVERAPAPPISHILRLMAAELLYAGRPAHAAVDSAVRLAQGVPRGERLAKLVNAVGRRLGRSTPQPAAPVVNLPAWLAERLAADWGDAALDAMAKAHLAPAPHDLSLRTPADREALAAEVDGLLLPSGSVRVPGRPQVTALPGYAEGAWWVQDAAAALPARLLSPAPGARVLDLCAAPGAKTLQLAAMGAEVTALDISARRVERLHENLARTGLAARIVVADALDWSPPAPFDAILIDAPCSATGTIRRHPDLPHRLDPASLDDLTRLQGALLDRAFAWLAPGGRLVFATCSLFRAEGEDQAAAFLARTPAARRVALDPADAALPPGAVDDRGDLRTLSSMLPEIGGLDGFFACRIERT